MIQVLGICPRKSETTSRRGRLPFPSGPGRNACHPEDQRRAAWSLARKNCPPDHAVISASPDVGEVPAHANQDHRSVELAVFKHRNPPKRSKDPLPPAATHRSPTATGRPHSPTPPSSFTRCAEGKQRARGAVHRLQISRCYCPKPSRLRPRRSLRKPRLLTKPPARVGLRELARGQPFHARQRSCWLRQVRRFAPRQPIVRSGMRDLY